MSKKTHIRSDIADLIKLIASIQGKSEAEVIAEAVQNYTKKPEG